MCVCQTPKPFPKDFPLSPDSGRIRALSAQEAPGVRPALAPHLELLRIGTSRRLVPGAHVQSSASPSPSRSLPSAPQSLRALTQNSGPSTCRARARRGAHGASPGPLRAVPSLVGAPAGGNEGATRWNKLALQELDLGAHLPGLVARRALGMGTDMGTTGSSVLGSSSYPKPFTSAPVRLELCPLQTANHAQDLQSQGNIWESFWRALKHQIVTPNLSQGLDEKFAASQVSSHLPRYPTLPSVVPTRQSAISSGKNG